MLYVSLRRVLTSLDGRTQQEREAQKEKEARIIMEKEKSEPVPLPVPSIEELMEEQSDVVGSEEVEFSPEQRRRGTLRPEF